MKAVLVFKLPDEASDFRMANNAAGMHSTLWDMEAWLRDKIKYHNEFKTPTEVLEAARDYLRESMNDNDVKFEP